MSLPSLILAAALVASSAGDGAPAPSAPVQLSLEDMEKLRCAATFALIARPEAQQASSPFPALAERGRDYFLQATAEVMDSAGLTPEALAERLHAIAALLVQDGRLDAALPSCLASLEQSGL